MARKPQLKRSLVAVWDILRDDDRRALLRVYSLPDYRPGRAPSRQLEGPREIDRIIRQRPGIGGQLREDLILRVDPEEA